MKPASKKDDSICITPDCGLKVECKRRCSACYQWLRRSIANPLSIDELDRRRFFATRMVARYEERYDTAQPKPKHRVMQIQAAARRSHSHRAA